MIPIAGWVAPFGYPRIKACSRLPMAFRSVPRPSSPPDAKASTECSYRALGRKGSHPSSPSIVRNNQNQRRTRLQHHAQKQNTSSVTNCQRPIIRKSEDGSQPPATELYSASNASDRIRRGLGAIRVATHRHPVRLADRSTPRDAPEPDSQYKDQQRSNTQPPAHRARSQL